ncbi:Protein argonaute 18 [Purpureocillium lavendulum]|uniref:Protein argonaute 18 n=1 Tax=Purpureocillium lavendulum TaxID=1247861 RepID=A0AB34FCP8_9HYPO|nr:Protein argonaute 18 [Purpureocillium lavendulum]
MNKIAAICYLEEANCQYDTKAKTRIPLQSHLPWLSAWRNPPICFSATMRSVELGLVEEQVGIRVARLAEIVERGVAVNVDMAWIVETEEATEAAAAAEDCHSKEATEEIVGTEEVAEGTVAMGEAASGEEEDIPSGGCPAPDTAITALEERAVRSNASEISELAVRFGKASISSSLGGTRPADLLPPRPAFGSNGRAVTLWANYYAVTVKPTVFYRYTVSFTQASTKGTGDSEGGSASKPQRREVKGRKLYFACQELIKMLAATNGQQALATEFKSKIISLAKLTLAENPVCVCLPVETAAEAEEVIEATIHGPVEIPFDGLLQYLASMEVDAYDAVFPKYTEAMDVLNVIFGHGPRSNVNEISVIGSERYFAFGVGKAVANLFHDRRALIAARGFFQSARLGTGRLLLNVNVTHGVFRPSGKLDNLFDSFGLGPTLATDHVGMRKLRAFAKFIPKTRVWIDLLLSNGKPVRKGKTIQSMVTASDLSRRPPAAGKPLRFAPGYECPGPKQVEFFLSDNAGGGKYITVFEYFRQKYKRDLKDYPLVDLGSREKPMLFPAELIEVQPGQSVKANLTMNETIAMLNMACRSPFANALSISTDARETLGLDDNRLDHFGITINKALLTVTGRVLDVPMISYATAQQRLSYIQPRSGSWNMQGVRVARPGQMVTYWTFMNITNAGPDSYLVGVDQMKRFAEFLHDNMGIGFSKSPTTPADKPTHMTWEQAMRGSLELYFKWAQDQEIQHIVFILSEKDSRGLYQKIKTLGDCVFGIHTNVTTMKHMQKESNPMYWANVGLKINLKAGGVNHNLRDEVRSLKDGKMMIVGYDVTHPTNMPFKAAGGPPSLVGLVASINKDLAQWPAVSWEQPARQEMLSDQLLDAFKSRLELWQRHNGDRLPANILIFRDGVSESQFTQVLDRELPTIRLACRAKYTTTQPKLTVVVSVKRHQTRFYPTTKEDMSASGNVLNGTVVDRGITQARYWDFFLTAHHAIKGTARPAHYTVLLDEIFRERYHAKAADELERLTHELCYLFGRATKAVSICPPAYYADIVCERARAHRPEFLDVSDSDSVATVGLGTAAASRQLHDSLKDTMYYI